VGGKEEQGLIVISRSTLLEKEVGIQIRQKKRKMESRGNYQLIKRDLHLYQIEEKKTYRTSPPSQEKKKKNTAIRQLLGREQWHFDFLPACPKRQHQR